VDELPASKDRRPEAPGARPATADQTCARAWQALRLAHDRVARRLTADLGAHCSLTISDFDVLLHLYLHGEEDARMSELTEAAMISQPALSRLVDRLEVRGLVSRSPAADDGRAVIVSLTGAGRDLTERAVAIHTRAVHDILADRLTEHEQDTLRQILTRLTESELM
jgi:DNA-binding MarR family transcriptional regulator